MQKKKEQSSEEFYGDLGNAFNFTYGDLQANQAGFISHRQAKIQRSGALRLSLFLIGAACFVVILYGIVHYFSRLPIDFFVLATAVVPIGFTVIAIVNFLIINRAIRKRLVQSAICRKTVLEFRGANYYLSQLDEYQHLTSKGSLISKDQFNLLNSVNYRIYYLPHSHQSSYQILSIEEAPNQTPTS
jgi:hypothetical protein